MSAKRRTVWISGASSGIGMAVARACHHRGDRLILSARRNEVLASLRAELGAEDVLIVPFDLAATDGLADLVDETWNAVGGVDLVIQSGGSLPRCRRSEPV